jgi:hypothetical protein
MAITRAQQAKQMLREGGRIGLKVGLMRATQSFAESYDRAVGNAPGTTTGKADPKGGFDLGGGQGPTFDGAPATVADKDVIKQEKEKYEQQFFDQGKIPPVGSRKTDLRTKINRRNLQKRLDFVNYLQEQINKKLQKGYMDSSVPGIDVMTEEELNELAPSVKDLVEKGFYSSTGKFATGEKIPDFNTIDLPGSLGIVQDIFEGPVTSDKLKELSGQIKTLEGLKTVTGLENTSVKDLMEEYQPNRFKLENPPKGGGKDETMVSTDPCKGPNPPAYCFVDPDPVDDTPQRNLGGLAPRFAGSIFDFDNMADGGRIGAAEGGIMPRLNQLSGSVSSAEQMLQEINQRLQSAESSLGEGGGTEVIQASGTFNDKPLFPEGTTFPSGGMKLPVFTGTPQQIDPPIFMRPGNIPGTDAPYSSLRGGNQFSQITPPQTPVAMQTPLGGIPAASYADGGRIGAAEGGIMDLETGRQMYFLGKLVKKATRAVKKIAGSKLGKAAILGGLTYFGMQGGGGFTGLLKKGFLKDSAGKFALDNLSPLKTIGIVSALSGLMSGDKEEDQEVNRGPKLTMEQLLAIRGNPFGTLAPSIAGSQFASAADGGRIGYQEGSKEPVAKETMPLLDMGGQEMDLREDGGFVPIGRMEKADDVPARLSKNEFVFTADAVRNAGDGDVDKGSEVMYNMMKNLESGGEVSEESQGLEGAREMFQTSKRLEEVL